MWLSFPTCAMARLLPLLQRPDDIEPAWALCLTHVYEDESWRELHRLGRQLEMLDEPRFEHDRGVDGLLQTYQQNLNTLLEERFMNKSGTLRNQSRAPKFELLFCVRIPSGIGPAKRIARHILDHK